MKSTYKQVKNHIVPFTQTCIINDNSSQIALRTHPDKNPDNLSATAEFQHVSEAYRVLLKYLDRPAEDEYGDYDDDDDYPSDFDYSEDEVDLDLYMYVAFQIYF